MNERSMVALLIAIILLASIAFGGVGAGFGFGSLFLQRDEEVIPWEDKVIEQNLSNQK